MDTRKIAEQNLIFQTIMGSHAYGTNIASSDVDHMGIFIGNKINILTPFFKVEQVENFQDKKDSVVYELTKFMALLIDQNPNLLSLLWVKDEFVKKFSPEYGKLKAVRDKLLSSKAKYTFCGYAHSQLQRIKGHNKWINNPQPTRRPKEVDFLSMIWNKTGNQEWNKAVPLQGFKVYHLSGEVYGFKQDLNLTPIFDRHEALLVQEGVITGIDFDLLVRFNREAYKAAVDNWKHYWEWKRNRNESRSELEAKYGYDTKHAMHLIRLLRMGKEILTNHEVHVFRSDAKELIDIRNGVKTYEQLVEEAEELVTELDSLYKTTTLRKEVDLHFAGELLLEIYENYWKRT